MRRTPLGGRQAVARRRVRWVPLAIALGLVALVAMTLLAMTHLPMQTIVTVAVALALALLAFGVVREG